MNKRSLWLIGLSAVLSGQMLHAQSAAFTYQGVLKNNGVPANGRYDLRFRLYDAVTNGTAISISQTNTATTVSNGLFTVQLDFGLSPFVTFASRWLDIGVRTNGAGSFDSLTPRQNLTVQPYALTATAVDLVGGNQISYQGQGVLSVQPTGTPTTNSLQIIGPGYGSTPTSMFLGADDLTVQVFRANFSGKVGIGVPATDNLLQVGTAYSDGTGWYESSDRNLKENFEPLDTLDVLEKVAAMPISKWNFKSQTDRQHVGPMAQDFHAAFGLGNDDKHIATVDGNGVALAAIQGLNKKVDEKDSRIHELENENKALAQRLSDLEQRVKQISEEK